MNALTCLAISCAIAVSGPPEPEPAWWLTVSVSAGISAATTEYALASADRRLVVNRDARRTYDLGAFAQCSHFGADVALLEGETSHGVQGHVIDGKDIPQYRIVLKSAPADKTGRINLAGGVYGAPAAVRLLLRDLSACRGELEPDRPL